VGGPGKGEGKGERVGLGMLGTGVVERRENEDGGKKGQERKGRRRRGRRRSRGIAGE
jgi:hypothetical protein